MTRLFQDEMNESQDNVDDNPKRIVPLEVDWIEQLNNHGMNQVLDEELLMQLFNLALQEQQQSFFERRYVADDDYLDWIFCVQAKEEQRFYIFANKSLGLTFHLFLIMMEEGNTFEYPANKWTKIKSKIKLRSFFKNKLGQYRIYQKNSKTSLHGTKVSQVTTLLVNMSLTHRGSFLVK